MLAVVGGTLALLGGLILLFLPLMASELSRPRDSVWGALVLLLGLVLVTSADRLTGAPMLAVLCGGLLIGRLGSEVGQARWRVLTPEERQQLGSAERWGRSFSQLGAALLNLLQSLRRAGGGVAAWIAERRQGRTVTKRWVRPENGTAHGTEEAEPSAAPATVGQEGDGEPEAPSAEEPAAEEAVVVESFEAIEAMLQATEPSRESAPVGGKEAEGGPAEEPDAPRNGPE